MRTVKGGLKAHQTISSSFYWQREREKEGERKGEREGGRCGDKHTDRGGDREMGERHCIVFAQTTDSEVLMPVWSKKVPSLSTQIHMNPREELGSPPL